VSRLGDPEEEPMTFLAVRVLAGLVGTVALGTGVLGDPLWLTATFGFAVGWGFAGSSYFLRRATD
jgi:hypothetical protein